MGTDSSSCGLHTHAMPFSHASQAEKEESPSFCLQREENYTLPTMTEGGGDR